MKTLLYRLFFLSIITTISLQGCIRTIEINEDGAPSGAIIRVATPVRANQTATFSIDVHVVNASGNFVNSLGPQNFSIKDTSSNPRGMTFKLLDVKGGGKTDLKGDYSAFLLLDQSGSTDATDPDNLRIQASKVFLEAIGQHDNVALGSFTTGYYYSYNQGYAYLHRSFTNNVISLYPSLDSLENSIINKGNTPLFTSTQWAINYTDKKAPNTNKAIVLFTDGENNGSSSQAITEALSIEKKIPIFTVGLSDGVNFKVLNNMALNTGGSFMWAKDAKQLISYFGTLGNLLHGNANYYTLTFQATSSSFQNIDRVLFLQIKLNNGKTFLMPYVVSL